MNTAELPILVVDDDAMIRNLVSTVLKRQGFEVDHASDGLEGLERLTEKRYSVVLLDLMMPRIDGLAFLERLRKDFPKDQHPMILVMTAASDALVRQLDPGLVQGVVRKPFDIAELAAVVRECADRSET
jgi:CheY-like chemotaxis protein